MPRTDNLEAWLALWRADSEKIIAISGCAGGHNDTGMRSEDLWWLASNSGRAEERKSGARSLPRRQTGVARDASLWPAGLAGSGDDPPEELARGARASLEISTIRSLPRRSNRVVGDGRRMKRLQGRRSERWLYQDGGGGEMLRDRLATYQLTFSPRASMWVKFQ